MINLRDILDERQFYVAEISEENKVKITKLEVWHNAKNAEFLTKVDKIGCGGVPFFFNQKTGKAICGASSYEDLRKWALGK